MSIDNPKKAAEALIKAEERQDPVIPELVRAVTRFIPTPFKGIVENALAQIMPDQIGRIKYLLELYSAELDRHAEQISSLKEEHLRHLHEHHGGLLHDAVTKARDTRDSRRIQRMVRILVRGSLDPGMVSNPDRIEALNEAAKNLTEIDHLVLGHLMRRAETPVERRAPAGQRAPVAPGTYRGPSSEPPLEIEQNGQVSAEEIQTACTALQAYGLAIVDYETKWSGEYRAFRIQPKGKKFIQYIRDLPESQGQA